MYFWRDLFFRRLKDAAAEASASPEWADFVAYCTEYERGLRRKAFSILECFIAKMEHAPFADRRRFVSWLLHLAYLPEVCHIPLLEMNMLAPHPLRTRIIQPTLDEWLRAEPLSSEPHRWMGGYAHLKRAIELDPSDEIARRKFVSCILGGVRYATHELPHGYLGDTTEDMAQLAEAESALSGLPNEEDRRKAAAEITEQRRRIENYLHTR